MFEIVDLSVSADAAPIIANLSLQAAAPGVLAVVGPGGAGKSTLLHAVAGTGQGLQVSGGIMLDGVAVATLPAGALGWYPQYIQAVRTGRAAGGTESERQAWSRQRLDCLRHFLDQPHRLYLLDEPTVGLVGDDLALARQWLRQAATDAFVLIVTHNREDCLALEATVVIFAAGQAIEQGAAAQVFDAPATEGGKRYVQTGYLALPRPTRPVTVDGIWWVVRGFLCGMSRPGLVAETQHQYARLREGGVRHLVCLEEQGQADAEDLAAHGIALHHFPVRDMTAPGMAQADAFCRVVEQAVARGEGVAFHCKGGLGRTGTAIACALVWLGDDEATAIAKVRSGSPLAIQSEEQMQFIKDFSGRVSGRFTPAAVAATH